MRCVSEFFSSLLFIVPRIANKELFCKNYNYVRELISDDQPEDEHSCCQKRMLEYPSLNL